LKALAQMGVPVDGLSFDPEVAMRGLVIDAKNGNLLKVDRFGLVKRAMHGQKMMTPSELVGFSCCTGALHSSHNIHYTNAPWLQLVCCIAGQKVWERTSSFGRQSVDLSQHSILCLRRVHVYAGELFTSSCLLASRIYMHAAYFNVAASPADRGKV
jgi:hypothetical protein